MRGTWTRRRSMKENMVNPSQILTVCTLTVTLIMSLLAEPRRHTVVVCVCVYVIPPICRRSCQQLQCKQ